MVLFGWGAVAAGSCSRGDGAGVRAAR